MNDLIEILIGIGKINKSQREYLNGLIEKSKKNASSILLESGFLKDGDIAAALSIKHKIKHLKLKSEDADKNLFIKYPAKILERCKALPVRLTDENTALFAVVEPDNIRLIDNLKLVVREKMELAVISDSNFKQLFDEMQTADSNYEDLIKQLSGANYDYNAITDSAKLLELANDGPIIRLVDKIISCGILKNASDIHIKCLETEIEIRYRIDGILIKQPAPPKELQAPVISRLKIMAELKIEERQIPQDGRIKWKTKSKEIDIRVSTLPSIFGESVVLRILDKQSTVIGLDKIGFSKNTFQQFQNIIEKPNGIILVTGPTGSGKTTTLYATLNKVNTAEVNIITVEDPVEYPLSGATQVMVNPKRGLTFASGLRSILRQDPDIVMVGEIRDNETAEIAAQTALTGHLVFSTLHTNDAVSAVMRLKNMGIPNYLIAGTLLGVLAQRLARSICCDCKIEYEPEPEKLDKFKDMPDFGERSKFFKGSGCSSCNYTGYKGRIGIYELFISTMKFAEAIIKNASAVELKQTALTKGMIPLKTDGWLKIKSGLTTIDEILWNVGDE